MPEQHKDTTDGGPVQGANRGGTIVSDVVIDSYAQIIGVYALAVYFTIVRHYNRNHHESYPSIDLMAAKLNTSSRQVKRAIRLLRAHRMIVVWRRGRHNVYTLYSI